MKTMNPKPNATHRTKKKCPSCGIAKHLGAFPEHEGDICEVCIVEKALGVVIITMDDLPNDNGPAHVIPCPKEPWDVTNQLIISWAACKMFKEFVEGTATTANAAMAAGLLDRDKTSDNVPLRKLAATIRRQWIKRGGALLPAE